MILRLKMGKRGPAAFISHLDFSRAVERALRRARLPVAFSRGFNPHPRMSFASALALGTASDSEYVDIEFSEDVAPEKVMSSLNASLPEGIQVIAARVLPEGSKPAAAEVQRADYVALIPGVDGREAAEAAADILERQEVIVERKDRKKGVKEVDLRPKIEKITVEECPGGVCLRLGLAAGSGGSVRPEEVIRLMAEAGGWDLELSQVSITRVGLYGKGAEGLTPL